MLAQDAPLLVIDEPTAHLDAASTRAVRSGISHLMSGCTVIWVTHDRAMEPEMHTVVELSPAWRRTDLAVAP